MEAKRGSKCWVIDIEWIGQSNVLMEILWLHASAVSLIRTLCFRGNKKSTHMWLKLNRGGRSSFQSNHFLKLLVHLFTSRELRWKYSQITWMPSSWRSPKSVTIIDIKGKSRFRCLKYRISYRSWPRRNEQVENRWKMMKIEENKGRKENIRSKIGLHATENAMVRLAVGPGEPVTAYSRCVRSS